MQTMTIGEVAHKMGIQTSAIRYYESIELLPPPERVNGQRRYDPSILQHLGVIHIARQAGFGISEIRKLLHDFPVETTASIRWQKLAGQKLSDLDALIEKANDMKAILEQTLQCQCDDLVECVALSGSTDDEMIKVRVCCGG